MSKKDRSAGVMFPSGTKVMFLDGTGQRRCGHVVKSYPHNSRGGAYKIKPVDGSKHVTRKAQFVSEDNTL